MNANALIEIAQSKSKQVYSNGDYEVEFAQPIYLENGDRFALSKTFIDTETESEGVIVIPKGGVTIYIEVQPYIQYDDVTKFNSGIAANLTDVDNSEYLLYEMNKDTSPAAAGNPLMELITEIQFNYKTAQGKVTTWGNTDGKHPLQFTATHIDGTTYPVYVELPALKTHTVQLPWADAQEGTFLKKDLNIYTKIKQVGATAANFKSDISLVPNNSDGSWTFNKIPFKSMGDDVSFGSTVFARTLDPSKGGFDLVPSTYLVEPFIIPEGKYTPDVLCTHINDNLNINSFPKRVVDGAKGILNTAFLHQAFDLPMDADPDLTIADPPKAFILVPAEPRFSQLPTPANQAPTGGLAGFTPIPNPLPLPGAANFPYNNYLIGTNLVELQYSSETDSFYWNYLHFPIYTDDGTIVTQFKKVGTGTNPTNSQYIQNSKNGGVIFTSLEATAFDPKTGIVQPFPFFDAVLGFNVGGDKGLIPKIIRHNKFSAGTNSLYSASVPILVDGQNTTNAGFVIDDIVDKKQSTVFNLNSNGTIGNFESTSGFNNVIYANSSLVSNGILDSAYYLVEIHLNFASNVIGADSITRNLSGIINRYYSKGSYVSAGGDPSFIIDYRGASTAISSLRVRILNPDGSVADLGKDNTLFFELIKAPPQPPQPQQPPPPPPKK